MNRSLKSSGQTSAECSEVRSAATPAASKSALGRALTSGRRLRATQPVSPWPLRIVSCWITLRFDAGREPAAQRLGLVVVEEQRAARERHDVAQLRRDERHRVGRRRGCCPSPARSRRARRFRGARARCPGRRWCATGDSCTSPTAGCAARRVRRHARELARRLLARLRFRRERRIHVDEGLHHARVERLAASCRSSPIAASRLIAL